MKRSYESLTTGAADLYFLATGNEPAPRWLLEQTVTRMVGWKLGMREINETRVHSCISGMTLRGWLEKSPDRLVRLPRNVYEALLLRDRRDSELDPEYPRQMEEQMAKTLETREAVERQRHAAAQKCMEGLT